MDNAVLCILDRGSFYGGYFTGTWCGVYGSASCHICWRNLVNTVSTFYRLFRFATTAFYSQPKIRGILVACSGVAVMLGVFLMYLLGTLMHWRNVALTCLFLPIIAFIVICFVSGDKRNSKLFPVINDILINSCPKHLYGFCPKDARMKPSNPFNGFADGFLPRRSL